MSEHEPLGPLSPDFLESDFYGYQSMLDDSEIEVVLRTRRFLQDEVAPRANEFWEKATSPVHLMPKIAELEIAGLGYGFGDRKASRKLLTGWLEMEFARVDPSTGTMFSVHSSLAMSSISILGSEEQRERWLPAMRRMEKIGAFGLSEPHGGSDVAGGLETTARLDGDHWILNGSKRWIGNATFADLTIVFAKDEADGEVKGFVVEQGFEGFRAEKIEGKYSLRAVENADIHLENCRVPVGNKLAEANSFADTAKVLRLTRGGVAFQAVGVMMGAYERAVAYAREREQFGSPIASFQLISDLIARMTANITAALGMAIRVAQLQDNGVHHDEHAALAKTFCTTRLRETVGWAREILGGNGILIEHDVIRFFADAEALYSYEGTAQINNLIVGRGVTGFGAFV
ncbi:acyl-CoA dehydrogenase family protein [Rhodococcus sp. IEGM 1401]|uniref:acyl-CoA dehydrogenase family protein n=1 Tax=unclassified Rhodococcus (in: high G+C Gram-positive bacteria) TaxID=192944 RepID=UPI0022B2BFFA|nr:MULTISPECIES: acyl-CoA dehydrogenase family protein [unclassified Rhodococcus (in: high G+C Gram-positive bacteria)]MCZ4559233.1 acyl-CoA dehydrogenase family protein [Rhodococcus sp. IEGM 1401]MDI9919814.1 acyl-CoA dehydrogenase family protein [Rhodococcus sp. IEGM 1372]MDI9925271.1 acyl-CoA dehydrogenase family protein [Rhodococcus sp. IEGM 1341]MDV8031812.1 acyl-CoA dehydrogenase family protein [Rhodococcus sp. IEGM 1414]MDV8053952.1 acyl-CoA dehydrogenase family protein [Rhodococcus sp.